MTDFPRTTKALSIAAAWERLAALPLTATCVGIFAASVAVRLAFMVALGTYATPSRTEVNNLAISLATAGTFADPFRLPTGPSAHAAPVYPWLLSLLYSAFGTGVAGEIAYEVFNNILTSAQFALLPAVSVALGLGLRTGALAGLAGALIPVHVLNEIRGGETAGAALALLLLSWLTIRGWQKQEASAQTAVFHGVCWGIGLLVSPTFLTVLLAIAVMTWRQFGGGRPALVHVLLLLAATTVVLLPWTWRNYTQLGAFVAVRGNLGLELAISNSPRSQAAIDDNERSGVYTTGHPYSSNAEALKVRALGEAAYNRMRMQDAIDWMRSAPGDFARLTALRTFYFWLPKTTRSTQAALLWLLTAAALAGFAALWVINPTAALLITAIWTMFPLPYYLLQASVRYRYPMHWTLLVLAALAAELAVRRLLSRTTAWKPVPTPLLAARQDVSVR